MIHDTATRISKKSKRIIKSLWPFPKKKKRVRHGASQIDTQQAVRERFFRIKALNDESILKDLNETFIDKKKFLFNRKRRVLQIKEKKSSRFSYLHFCVQVHGRMKVCISRKFYLKLSRSRLITSQTGSLFVVRRDCLDSCQKHAEK